MKTLNIKIALNWVSEYDVLECALTVPYDVTAYEIVDILQKEHLYLITEDKEDLYEIQGKTPDTLLDYVCEKYDWSWRKFKYDIEMFWNEPKKEETRGI